MNAQLWYIHIMKYYHVIKKEETTDACKDMNESQKPYAECKESYTKEYTDVWFYLYKSLE